MMFSRHHPGLVVYLECSMYLVDRYNYLKALQNIFPIFY